MVVSSCKALNHLPSHVFRIGKLNLVASVRQTQYCCERENPLHSGGAVAETPFEDGAGY